MALVSRKRKQPCDEMTDKQYGKWLFLYCRKQGIKVTPRILERLVEVYRPENGKFSWGMCRKDGDTFLQSLLEDIVFICLINNWSSIEKPCMTCGEIYLFHPDDYELQCDKEDQGQCSNCVWKK